MGKELGNNVQYESYCPLIAEKNLSANIRLINNEIVTSLIS
jgi:hypothetical protein